MRTALYYTCYSRESGKCSMKSWNISLPVSASRSVSLCARSSKNPRRNIFSGISTRKNWWSFCSSSSIICLPAKLVICWYSSSKCSSSCMVSCSFCAYSSLNWAAAYTSISSAKQQKSRQTLVYFSWYASKSVS